MKSNPVLRNILEKVLNRKFHGITLRLRLASTDDVEMEFAKEVLTKYTEFLLKNNYCDSDINYEPSAIDRFLNPRLNK